MILGISGACLAWSTDYLGVVIMVVVYGVGAGMTQGTSQVYAMDLAPDRRRGAFLGLWSVFTNSSSILAPLFLGFLAETAGLAPTFVCVSVLLVLCASLTWLYGPETRAAT